VTGLAFLTNPWEVDPNFDINDVHEMGLGYGDWLHENHRHLIPETRQQLASYPGELALYDLGILLADGDVHWPQTLIEETVGMLRGRD